MAAPPDTSVPIWLPDLQRGRRRAKERAFEAFLDAWHERLYAHCRRMMGNHEDAADVTQETLIQVYKSASQFEGRSSFSTWVFTIASRKSLDALKRRKRDRTIAFEDAYSEAHAALQSDVHFSGDDAELQLHAAIAALPPRQRQVFNLRYFEELPFSQIAALTGTTEGSLKASYHHAAQKIKSFVTTSLELT
jgi:RNA polymerase sigma-70 factor (ECF subfamily)